MKRVLVTGGAGMIGSNLVKELIRQEHNVIVVDNLWRGKIDYLMDSDQKPVVDIDRNFFKRDLSLPGACDDLLDDVDYVVHLADIVAGIGYVFSNQGSLFRQNILINTNTIESARKSKIKGFLYVGTACSFPETLQNTLDYVPLKEEDLYPAQPESAYGWSKLMGQYETELLGKETDIQTCTLMLHNVYGSPCDYSPERSQVIPSLMRKAIRYPKEEFIVWGSGKQGRAFVHTRDVVRGIILAMENGWAQRHIQLGPWNCTSIKEIAEEIVRMSGKDIDIHYDLTKPEGDKARSADYTKAKNVLGWEPTVSLVEGLQEMYEWMSKQIRLL